MGIGGISIWQLLIILVIVLLLFGTKKLRNLGGDLGASIKSFKKAVKEGEDVESSAAKTPAIEENTPEETAHDAKQAEQKEKP